MATTFTAIAATMLLCIIAPTTITTVAANSNLVSITHRNNGGGDYTSGLNVVRSSASSSRYNNHDTPEEEEECVANFYRQKRDEKRELTLMMAAKNKNSQGARRQDAAADDAGHSLDHYFDRDRILMQNNQAHNENKIHRHHNHNRGTFFRRIHSKINSNGVIGGGNGVNKRAFLLQQTSRNDSQSVNTSPSLLRGGSILTRTHNNHHRDQQCDVHRNNSGGGTDNRSYYHHRSIKKSSSFPTHHRRHNHGDDATEFNSDHDAENGRDDEDFADNYKDGSDDDAADTPQQAGLLRVPCSIRINSDAASTTPIAAYVDTGAQVTVISASAARKAKILHLMDRRYAGRATGVGHCTVLGRIPAGCVHFVLGRESTTGSGEDDEYDEEDESNHLIQVDGPALTVLEGTVTQGVDMLLGLDVLQDWEATIQMGGSGKKSSITVKQRGMLEPVVLPFLVSGSNKECGKAAAERRRRNSSSLSSAATSTHNSQQGSRRHQHTTIESHHHARRHQSAIQQKVHNDNYNDEEDFSPISSDIESDLDILDQSEFTHEFPEGKRKTPCSDKIVHDIEREDELLGLRHSHSHHHHFQRRSKKSEDDDDDDELLHDSSEDDDEAEDEEGFDMSGL